MSTQLPNDALPRWRALPLALVLGLAALVLALADLQAHYGGLLPERAREAAIASVLHTPVLRRAIVGFIGAQLLLHLLLGVVAWIAAGLTIACWRLRAARLAVLGWFAALYLLVGLTNAAWYPWSNAGAWSRALLQLLHGRDWLPGTLATLLATAFAGQLAVLAWRSRWRRLALRVVVWGLLACLVVAVRANLPPPQPGAAAQRRPNLVFIGIDSLRPDLVGSNGYPGYTPNLTAFLAEGQQFDDVTTPLARTFPSWVALLTGRDPMRTGARENLLPRAALHTGPTLADQLRTAGYRTVFATDEVRFSNIDASFGFDQTITPRIGTSDFVLGTLNDVPLSNLFANTRVAQWLFPDTYANRAAAVTYEPETFVARVDRELQAGAGPLFLASHLTLPHWPYHWAADEDATLSRTADLMWGYLAAVVGADRQFGELLAVLERKGVLDNAIVVVFSDHGEALGLPIDNLVYSPEAKAAIGRLVVWMNGHGTSVLSPLQYHVVLGVRGFGNALADARPGVHAGDALCIEDVAPTMAELLGLPVAAGQYDGLSFARRLQPGSTAPPVGAGRVRFTETAFTTAGLREGAQREAELVGDADVFFRVNRASGRFEVNLDRWSEMLQVKERAAFDRRFLLAAVPGRTPGTSHYVAVPLAGGLPRRLLAPPGERDDADLGALWRALHEHYPGELGAPAQD